jgi:hypothetical protein
VSRLEVWCWGKGVKAEAFATARLRCVGRSPARAGLVEEWSGQQGIEPPMASLEDRGWVIVLTRKILTCGYLVTDDRINRD